MKNFIRFSDAEFNNDFEKSIFFELWTLFDSEINYFSNVHQNSPKILFNFWMHNLMQISKKIFFLNFEKFWIMI